MWQNEEPFGTIRSDISTYFIILVSLLTSSDVAVSTSAGFFFGILFLLFFMWLQDKTNGMLSYRTGAWAGIAVFLFIGCLAIFRPAHLSLWWIVIMIALNFSITGVVSSSQYTFTFIPDIGEMVTPKRREGEFTNINITLDMVLDSLFTLIVGVVLQATGFKPGAKIQSAAIVNASMILYTAVSICLLLLGIAFSYICKLNVGNHTIILNGIKRLRNGDSTREVTPETKKVVEDLTGFKYESCWGSDDVMNYRKSRKKSKEIEMN